MTVAAPRTTARFRTSGRRTVLAAAALAVTTALAASPTAHAAGPRPHFQMPVACGQTWEASTYWVNIGKENEMKHGPNLNSIDLAVWDNGANISEGEAVLASADGVVSKIYTTAPPADAPELGGEHRVYIDHGDGWTTWYIHLQSLPPLKVGQKVAQGQRIGTVGKSGADSPHLHYTQLADGVAVQVAFNGSAIKTGEADETTWNHYGDGEKLTSSNCVGRSFLPFEQSGKHHLLAYTPQNGESGIASISADGKAITNPWQAKLALRWTHFMPFQINGDQRFVNYKTGTGETHFNRIGTGGPTKLSGGTWGKGWTHLVPFTLGGNPYYIAHDSLTGATNVDRINATGNGSTTLQSTWWTKGWTQLVPFRLGSVQYLLSYRGSTGEVKVNSITGSGNTVTFTTVYQGTWSTGWTNIVPTIHNGAVHLLRYSQSHGWASFDKVNAGGAGFTHYAYANWSRTWAVFSPFTIGGKGHVLLYKTNGETKIVKFDDDGAGVTTISNLLQTPGMA